MAPPLADIMRDPCECRRRLDEKWGNIHDFDTLFWQWRRVSKHVASYYPMEQMFQHMLDERWGALQTHSLFEAEEEEDEEDEEDEDDENDEDDEDRDPIIREFDENGHEVLDGMGGWLPIIYDFMHDNMQHFVSKTPMGLHFMAEPIESGVVYLRNVEGEEDGWHEWNRIPWDQAFGGTNVITPIIYTELIPRRTVSFHATNYRASHYRLCWISDQSLADMELSREVSGIIFITGDGNAAESDEDAADDEIESDDF